MMAEDNRGIRVREHIQEVAFPRADEAVRRMQSIRPEGAVDILFVNPPAPDGGIWIRSQHRVGRRSREGMIWPQVDLAQMAALFPDYRVAIVDAVAERMGWPAFERLLRERRPRYYVTQVAGPTLQNDMYGCFLAKSLGATTVAFGTHVTPLPVETMRAYPALDYILRGEPELTLRELVDRLENPDGGDPWARLDSAFRGRLEKLFQTPNDPRSTMNGQPILGLVWRAGGEVVVNPDRPLIRHLDDLPLPRHDLLPLRRYRAPLVGGPYAFIVTSRGCPAGCRFCIKHVNYGNTVRFRSPENVLQEIERLLELGIRDLHMYADLFTVNREHVLGICEGLLERGWKVRWTCNSRVDFVDEEMLRTMGKAGCWMIAWGIESGDAEVLRRARKGYDLEQPQRALSWARAAGIKNWGYFIIGLPGETEETIRETMALALRLPLDLALFHIAAPHPGTPFFFEVVEQGWFRPGTRWEQVDMDRCTVLEYPHLPAEALERWARVAFRRWAFRPGPLWTLMKMLLRTPGLWPMAFRIGVESL
ncbi:MAG: B12-binding domain-containing radical SAM protein, partial [Chloroflexia bacterium]